MVKAWLRPPRLHEKAFKRFMTWLAEILLLSEVCVTQDMPLNVTLHLSFHTGLLPALPLYGSCKSKDLRGIARSC